MRTVGHLNVTHMLSGFKHRFKLQGRPHKGVVVVGKHRVARGKHRHAVGESVSDFYNHGFLSDFVLEFHL